MTTSGTIENVTLQAVAFVTEFLHVVADGSAGVEAVTLSVAVPAAACDTVTLAVLEPAGMLTTLPPGDRVIPVTPPV